MGGGFNHRNGLYDAVMLKDNHIAFAGSISKAVETVREAIGHTVKIEVEIETFEQLQEAVAAKADIIMFDNCTPESIQEWREIVPRYHLDGSIRHDYGKNDSELCGNRRGFYFSRLSDTFGHRIGYQCYCHN